jgi:hypothetical protein
VVGVEDRIAVGFFHDPIVEQIVLRRVAILQLLYRLDAFR